MRKVVEIQPMGYPNGRQRVAWRIIETRVKGTAAVQVSELPLKVPRYSFRVGSAQIDEQGGGDMRIGPRLTIFNVQDATELLEELSKKYVDLRESKIEELEKTKEKWQGKYQTGAPAETDDAENAPDIDD
jgi:hypothetical protein